MNRGVITLPNVTSKPVMFPVSQLERRRGALTDRVVHRASRGGRHRCNIWQGVFPTRNLRQDGHLGTAPARSFPPNGYGLHNTAGNVWEWCSDRFGASYYAESPRRDSQGPSEGEARVMRGGSYLCHESYCNRYRVAARSSNTPDSSTGNTGFRCAADA
jgi:formylglycine-generating enzyme required for sulfatase activity